MYHYEDHDHCPGCGRNDLGWEMSDVRSSLEISTCDDSESCEEGCCDCETHRVKVTIRRVWDRTCDYCDGADYRCVYDLSLDGVTLKTFASEAAADDYAAKVFPTAKAPEPDYAWESERGLRIAEGWGC